MMPGDFTYEITRRCLHLKPRGTPTEAQRQHAYDLIAADPAVPESALVVLDFRRLDGPLDLEEVERRARVMVARLGRKLGPVCAVIVPPRMAIEAQHLQALGERLGVRIGLFHDEREALGWLAMLG